jgi:hypothetical protein
MLFQGKIIWTPKVTQTFKAEVYVAWSFTSVTPLHVFLEWHLGVRPGTIYCWKAYYIIGIRSTLHGVQNDILYFMIYLL